MYHRRRRRTNRHYNNRNQPDLIDVLFELFVVTVAAFFKIIFKILSIIFNKGRGMKNNHQINKIYPNSTEPKAYIKHDSYSDVNRGYTDADNLPINTSSSILATDSTLDFQQTPSIENYEDKYKLKQSLLAPAEKEFLKVLEEVVGDSYIIGSQVQLSRIVNPKDSNKYFTNYHYFNIIKAKSIDFVLFNENYRPCLCIELDDSSHMRPGRKKRDVIVNRIMQGVGLRIIHVPTGYYYDREVLKKEIFQNQNI